MLTIVPVRSIFRILRFIFLVRDNFRHFLTKLPPSLRVLWRILVPGDDAQDVAGFTADVESARVIGYAVDFRQWEQLEDDGSTRIFVRLVDDRGEYLLDGGRRILKLRDATHIDALAVHHIGVLSAPC